MMRNSAAILLLALTASLAQAVVLPRWRIPEKGRLFVKEGGAPARRSLMNGLGAVEEGAFMKGRWVPGRRLAGGETIPEQTVSLCNKGTRRVTLYRYR